MPRDKEKRREYDRKRYAENPEKRREAERKRRAENPEKYREACLKHNYGLTLDGFNVLLEMQNGLCCCCQEFMTKPCVDHCHSTGRVRGLLCNHCNHALGYAKDNPETLRRLAVYLNAN
jgi:hypothetical protein